MRGAGGKGRHAAIVQNLGIPRPFDLGEFPARLEHQRNRPIRLCPFRAAPGVPCGLWIATADADYVYREEGTTPFHATHIKMHELAHMLLDHRNGTEVWKKLLSLLAPDVDPELVQLILGRTAYSTAEAGLPAGLAGSMPGCACTAWYGRGGPTAGRPGSGGVRA
jgi:hypothetical protein